MIIGGIIIKFGPVIEYNDHAFAIVQIPTRINPIPAIQERCLGFTYLDMADPKITPIEDVSTNARADPRNTVNLLFCGPDA